MTFTYEQVADALKELKREEGQRGPVYRRLIENRKLSQQQADRQVHHLSTAIAVLEHVLTTLTPSQTQLFS